MFVACPGGYTGNITLVIIHRLLCIRPSMQLKAEVNENIGLFNDGRGDIPGLRAVTR